MLPKQLKDSQRHQRQPKQVELFLQSESNGRHIDDGESDRRRMGKKGFIMESSDSEINT